MQHSHVVVGVAIHDSFKSEAGDTTTTDSEDAIIEIDALYLGKEPPVWPENLATARKRLFARLCGRGRLTVETIVASLSLLVPSSYVLLVMSLIFGGCCTNVYVLEAIIREHPDFGSLITFTQFSTIVLCLLPAFVSIRTRPPFVSLSRRSVPLRKWVIFAAFSWTVNELNHWTLGCNIPMPVQIVTRSGGPAVSMVVGYLLNARTYSRGQIAAVVLLTGGVVFAAGADSRSKRVLTTANATRTNAAAAVGYFTPIAGFAVILVAMIIAAFQGIYAERVFETHGKTNWKEALFYTHALSLPVFLPRASQLVTQAQILTASPPLFPETSVTGSSTLSVLAGSQMGSVFSCVLDSVPRLSRVFAGIFSSVGHQMVYLLVNGFTQYLCIRGVYFLTARSSHLTVTMVLSIRKLVSLVLSIWLYGNRFPPACVIGAILVFAGGLYYGFENARVGRAEGYC